MLLGSHLSIAGGLDNALREARRYRFAALAMFVRNQRQWACRPLEEETAERFRALRRKFGTGPVAAHGSYLLNLCGEEEVRGKSIEALTEDLGRCRRLEIDYLVIHPGSCEDAARGVRQIAEGLDEVMRREAVAFDQSARLGPEQGAEKKTDAKRPSLAGAAAADNIQGGKRVQGGMKVQGGKRAQADCEESHCPMVLLETTAGAGRGLGSRFEELAEVLALLERPQRFGVCLDTCHVFAAGYDIRSSGAYAETMGRFEQAIGLARLKVVHVNDSVGDLGSRLDRHEHIGKGKIGLAGFANLVRDPRLAGVPFILETPKEKDARGRDWDRVNAQTLRRLAKT